MKNNQELIDSMIYRGVLVTPRIIDAFRDIDRKYFVPESFKEHIYVDAPLPIGNNQTISQPSTVAFMLEHLEPQRGNKVLDIGSGSGWTASLLCHIIGDEGNLKGVDRIDSLVQQGRKNLSQFHFGTRCSIQKAGDKLGFPGEKFDRILVSASADEIPEELFEQLNIGGILVIPVKNSIFKFKKISDTSMEKEEFYGFTFVPLIYQS